MFALLVGPSITDDVPAVAVFAVFHLLRLSPVDFGEIIK